MSGLSEVLNMCLETRQIKPCCIYGLGLINDKEFTSGRRPWVEQNIVWYRVSLVISTYLDKMLTCKSRSRAHDSRVGFARKYCYLTWTIHKCM